MAKDEYIPKDPVAKRVLDDDDKRETILEQAAMAAAEAILKAQVPAENSGSEESAG